MKNRLVVYAGMLTLITGSLYALKRDEITFTREFTLSKVDIEINSDGSIENILPESEYDYHVSLTNEGEDCYIRVLDIPEEIEVDTLWKKIGDYYYYPDIVESGKTVEFTNHIAFHDISKELPSIEWNIIAEAIQAKNFEYDLNCDDPFQGEEIISFELGGELE